MKFSVNFNPKEYDIEIRMVKRISREEPVQVPRTFPLMPENPMPLYPPIQRWDSQEPCMFDSLPPGAYLLSCPCSRHSVVC
jgi:hypothetical protein